MYQKHGVHNSHWFSIVRYCVGRWKLHNNAWIDYSPRHWGTAVYKYVRRPPEGSVGLAEPGGSQAKPVSFLMHRAFACVSKRFFSVPNWDHKTFSEKKPHNQTFIPRAWEWLQLLAEIWLLDENWDLSVIRCSFGCYTHGSVLSLKQFSQCRCLTAAYKNMADVRMKGGAKA